MGLDEENQRFFNQPVIVGRPRPGERFTIIDIGLGLHAIVQGPVIFASTDTVARINEHSKSDYSGQPVPGRIGLIERIRRS